MISNRLVSTCIEILRLLSDQILHYNEIIRQTSVPDKWPDRNHINEAIGILRDGRLIEEVKMSKRERQEKHKHSQAVLMQPTGLGRTFTVLTDSVKRYNGLYDELKQAIKQHFDLPPKDIDRAKEKAKDKKILVNVLHSRGWDKHEAANYNSLRKNALSTLWNLSPRQNIDALLNRYVSLLSQSDIINNENAVTILNKIITDLLSGQISFILKDIGDKANSGLLSDEDEQQRLRQEPLFDYLPKEKLAILSGLFSGKPYDSVNLESRFTNKEAKEVLLAILNIFKPSREAIEYPYDSVVVREAVKEYFKQTSAVNAKTT